jgi:hypothetical protein
MTADFVLRSAPMLGVIDTINHAAQSGSIKGEDGTIRQFRRAGMVLWGVFDILKPGESVRFDLEFGRAINVELVRPTATKPPKKRPAK